MKRSSTLSLKSDRLLGYSQTYSKFNCFEALKISMSASQCSILQEDVTTSYERNLSTNKSSCHITLAYCIEFNKITIYIKMYKYNISEPSRYGYSQRKRIYIWFEVSSQMPYVTPLLLYALVGNINHICLKLGCRGGV